MTVIVLCFQSFGTNPWCKYSLNKFVKYGVNFSRVSCNTLGCNMSGPGDLSNFNSFNFFSTADSDIKTFGIVFMGIIEGSLLKSSAGSTVYMLLKKFENSSAFSESSEMVLNLVPSLMTISPTPETDFVLDLTYCQNFLGLSLHVLAMSDCTLWVVFLVPFLARFLVRLYSLKMFISLVSWYLVHSLCFLLIICLSSLSIGWHQDSFRLH